MFPVSLLIGIFLINPLLTYHTRIFCIAELKCKETMVRKAEKVYSLPLFKKKKEAKCALYLKYQSWYKNDGAYNFIVKKKESMDNVTTQINEITTH